jgi:hypothetical protein
MHSQLELLLSYNIGMALAAMILKGTWDTGKPMYFQVLEMIMYIFHK